MIFLIGGEKMIVETAYGKVKGIQENDVYVWKGIPYAAPPIGPNRFRPPTSLESWNGVKDCSEFGPSAWQPSLEIMSFLGNQTTHMSEDCLTLNIWSPGTDGKKRPVLVWIHGGAFISDSGSSPLYDGTSFAKNGDLVVVTINYRLGILGFLHLAELGGDGYQNSGNCGILDQIAALKWVKENIAAFGGDPDQVTIFGESAGAMSVGVLLASPKAKGLFNQAILQSGAASHVIKSEKATKNTEFLLHELGLEKTEFQKLEEIPVEQLIEVSVKLPMMSLIPVIDGEILPKHPKELLAEGAAKDIPVLIGTNKDKYRLFTVFDPIWKKEDQAAIKKRFQQTFGTRWTKISQEFIKGKELTQSLYEKLMTIMTFTHPAIHVAEIQTEQGSPVWMYRFDWESQAFNGLLKSCHALEIPFVWNTFSKHGVENFTGDSPSRQELSKKIHNAWIAFAQNGDPNINDLPNWPKYDLQNRTTLIFNSNCEVVHDPDREERIKWEVCQER